MMGSVRDIQKAATRYYCHPMAVYAAYAEVSVLIIGCYIADKASFYLNVQLFLLYAHFAVLSRGDNTEVQKTY